MVPLNPPLYPGLVRRERKEQKRLEQASSRQAAYTNSSLQSVPHSSSPSSLTSDQREIGKRFSFLDDRQLIVPASVYESYENRNSVGSIPIHKVLPFHSDSFTG